MDSVIELIQTTYTQDQDGVHQPSSNMSRQVYCQVGPITRAEFSAAGRNGLNPSYVFTVFATDYQGEQTVNFNGLTYSVYRTYRRPEDDYIEIYVERKGGTNAPQNASR